MEAGTGIDSDTDIDIDMDNFNQQLTKIIKSIESIKL
jgi:hypothetical protein